MKPLLLSDIIKNIHAVCDAAQDITITGVSTDTRTIQQGDLFIALVGEKFDAHDYIDVAEQNGAAAVVCSKPVAATVPVLLVDDTLSALHRLASYYKSTLPIKVVAVTGSNGKTTTRDMIATVLGAKYKVYSTAKNFNNEIGLPKSVLELDESYDIAVLEMGMNHLGEISRLTNIAKPDAAVITNVGMAHIGNLGSQENILKAKLEILEGLHSDGLLVINGDDTLLSTADTGAFEKRMVGIKSDKDLYLRAENLEPDGNATQFDVLRGAERFRGSIPRLGDYNVMNALEAICIGDYFGVSIPDAFTALAGYTSVGMRCEAEMINGINLVKDYYNASPDSARVALETLRNYANGGNTYALLGEMLELGAYGEQAHYQLGEKCVATGVSHAFFIGAHYQSFAKAMPQNATVFDSTEREALEQAIRDFVAAGALHSGDAVLIKGSRGTRMEQFYEVLKAALIAQV